MLCDNNFMIITSIYCICYHPSKFTTIASSSHLSLFQRFLFLFLVASCMCPYGFFFYANMLLFLITFYRICTKVLRLFFILGVVVINTSKSGPVQYINYDDVCFSGGTDRPVQFYFNHIPSW